MDQILWAIHRKDSVKLKTLLEDESNLALINQKVSLLPFVFFPLKLIFSLYVLTRRNSSFNNFQGGMLEFIFNEAKF